MKRINNILLIFILLILQCNCIFLKKGHSQIRSAYESYYLWTKSYPQLWDPDWWPGDREIQGVTHDDANWYFTWTNDDPNFGIIWKVPVWVDLENYPLLQTNTIIRDMTQYPFLNDNGYWHWGDPDHYTFNNTTYIIVPMTAGSTCSINSNQNCSHDCECPPGETCVGKTPIVGFFRANDLSLAAYGKLTVQSSVGWCAIKPGLPGDLYTSTDYDYTSNMPKVCLKGDSAGKPCKSGCDCPGSTGCVGPDCDEQSFHFYYRRTLIRYSVPWGQVPSSGYTEITLTPDTSLEFRGENGEFIEMYNMQGGEFTDSGELLYISCGSGCCAGIGSGQQYSLDGIYVFETNSYKQIKRSTNHHLGQISTFDYYYIPGCDGAGWGFDGSWSPEGLTIWDLNSVPEHDSHFGGQLHTMTFHYVWASGGNEALFEHFTNELLVDAVNGISPPTWPPPQTPLPGDILNPFKTFHEAYNFYPAWDGGEIILKSGSYFDPGIYSKRIKINSQGGTSTIGGSK